MRFSSTRDLAVGIGGGFLLWAVAVALETTSLAVQAAVWGG